MVFNWLISATLWGRSSNVWEGKLPLPPNSVWYNVVVLQHANLPNRMVYGYLVVILFGKGSHITTISTHQPDSEEVPFFPYFKCGQSQAPQH